jgi:hypothetical protein
LAVLWPGVSASETRLRREARAPAVTEGIGKGGLLDEAPPEPDAACKSSNGTQFTETVPRDCLTWPKRKQGK